MGDAIDLRRLGEGGQLGDRRDLGVLEPYRVPAGEKADQREVIVLSPPVATASPPLTPGTVLDGIGIGRLGARASPNLSIARRSHTCEKDFQSRSIRATSVARREDLGLITGPAVAAIASVARAATRMANHDPLGSAVGRHPKTLVFGR